MRERAISAVIIAALVIAFFLAGQPWLTFGIAVLSFVAAMEVFRLLPQAGFPVRLLPGVILPPLLVLAMGLDVVDAGWLAVYVAAVVVILAIAARASVLLVPALLWALLARRSSAAGRR